jgi:hypothetical protein
MPGKKLTRIQDLEHEQRQHWMSRTEVISLFEAHREGVWRCVKKHLCDTPDSTRQARRFLEAYQGSEYEWNRKLG